MQRQHDEDDWIIPTAVTVLAVAGLASAVGAAEWYYDVAIPTAAVAIPAAMAAFAAPKGSRIAAAVGFVVGALCIVAMLRGWNHQQHYWNGWQRGELWLPLVAGSMPGFAAFGAAAGIVSVIRRRVLASR